MPNPSDDVHLKRKGKTIKLKSAWVCCGVIKDTHWEIPEGLEYILVLRFKPSSFYSIFNIDPTIFRAQPVCSLQDIVDESWARRIEEMYRKDTVAERITFMSDVLSSYDESNYLPFLLQSAIDYIDERKGNTTVADVLDTLGEKVNHKWLQRNFVKYIGITPKKYISLQRFVYTYSQYDRDKSSDLFTAAITNGYYDYNHFFKDFKQYIGVAPSQYAWD
ncbi:helix-turn-helix domain-containing protein [Pontibacter beigongshangensis]|uniref:helix-turn-helix domain-containing protein n=1 Tax=Pontibacter beigongshangensis TaxID=2574733 RepID=UPI00164F6E30|nr:helix-turn-helix domain-containing protein [Pontibacter beigongshangensis]